MMSAMNNSAIPTSGGVTLSLRIRALASSSAASVLRSVEHFAARLRATGAPSLADNRGRRRDLLELDDAELVGHERQRLDEAPAGRAHLAHPASELAEQQAVPGAGCLVERTLVAGVAGEQHRHHVDERAELMAQVEPDGIGSAHRVAVHDHRCQHGGGQRDERRDEPPDGREADQMGHREQRARHQQAGDRGGDEHADVDVDGAPDEMQRPIPGGGPQARARADHRPADTVEAGRAPASTGRPEVDGLATQVLHGIDQARARLPPAGDDQPRRRDHGDAAREDHAGRPHRAATGRDASAAEPCPVRNRLGRGYLARRWTLISSAA